MANESYHIPEQDLLLAADGALSPHRMAKVREHLTACWACRARLDEIETSIVEFVRFHQHNVNPKVPPAKGPRAVLQARLSELARNSRPGIWERLLALCFNQRTVVAVCVVVSIAIGIAAWRAQKETVEVVPASEQSAVGMTPDPTLTPGMTHPLTKAELCAVHFDDNPPAVPRPVALLVFESYGIHEPIPRAYELDYLVTPELGGTNDIRNLWPQPYHAGSWSAHAKDALEDRLYALVCAGELDLPTAQHDLAADWVAAYRKYFRTENPLPVHAAFLKDQPWE